MSQRSDRSDHSYVRPWNRLTFQRLRLFSDTPANEVEKSKASVYQNSAGVSYDMGSSQANGSDETSDKSLCVTAFRSALDATKMDWTKVPDAQRCCRYLDVLLQMDDDQLNRKFGSLLTRMVTLLDKIRKDSNVDRRKSTVLSEIYKLQIASINWNIPDSTSRLSESEKHYTAVVLIKYSINELLRLVETSTALSVSFDEDLLSPQSSSNQHSSVQCQQMEKQTIYYVGGFLIKRLLNKVTSTSPLSQELRGLLQGCVLATNSIQYANLPWEAEWTQELNRGGLVLITEYCYKLFLSMESFAIQSSSDLPNYEDAVNSVEVDNSVYLLCNSIGGDFSQDAMDLFKKSIAKDFLQLRGSAVAKQRLEMAVLNDELRQDRRGLRSHLHRLEAGRVDNKK